MNRVTDDPGSKTDHIYAYWSDRQDPYLVE